MELRKILCKYIQDKTMHYSEFRRLYLNEFKEFKPTDYERGYIAGICHALKEVNSDLSQDSLDIDNIIVNNIGTGLRWCRKD
jgi:hypothetical protein